MKSQHILIIGAVIIIVLGGILVFKKPDSSTPMPEVTNTTEEKSVPDMTYSIEDVAAHSTKDNCWQAINDIVYDFTPYLSSGDHPGGAAMSKDCGTDASFTYENDPPHSEYARSLLPEYAIGMLE